MPKRSNEFQKLVFLVKQQAAQNCTVTESKMLTDRSTGTKREVDVCIETAICGHPVMICVECTKKRRVADVSWVDAMKAKHERLPTSKLVLASCSGFTKEAREICKKHGIETLAMEAISDESVKGLLAKLQSVWGKTFQLTPTKVLVRFAEECGLQAESIVVLPDNSVYLLDGKQIGPMLHVVQSILQSKPAIEEFSRFVQQEHKSFWVEWLQPESGPGNTICLQKLKPLILRPIKSIRIEGGCGVSISEFPLRHGALGEVQVAWGVGTLCDQEALLVSSEDKCSEPRASITMAGITSNLWWCGEKKGEAPTSSA